MKEASRNAVGFCDQVSQFLGRVEHRVARSPGEREAAFRLRFEAYDRIGQRIGFQKGGALDVLYDPLFDDDPNGLTTMTFVDGELAGTVRVNVGFDEHAALPGLKLYADALAPILRAGRVIVEFTRLAAKLSISSVYPQLAYVIMRPAYMAAVHFDADFAVASPRAEHITFYRRTFGGTIWCSPRVYPGFTVKAACVGSDLRAVRSYIETRYPFYTSTPAEREALFGGSERRLVLIEKAAAPIPSEITLESAAALPACA